MFELCREEDKLQKVFILAVIFETLNIAKYNANHRHVVVHFKKDKKFQKEDLDYLTGEAKVPKGNWQDSL